MSVIRVHSHEYNMRRKSWFAFNEYGTEIAFISFETIGDPNKPSGKGYNVVIKQPMELDVIKIHTYKHPSSTRAREFVRQYIQRAK